MGTRKKAAPRSDLLERTVVFAWTDVPPNIVYQGDTPELARAWRDGFNYSKDNLTEIWTESTRAVTLDVVMAKPSENGILVGESSKAKGGAA